MKDWSLPNAKSIPIRPLDKGLILNVSSQQMPDGSFIRLDNLIANREGPRRRPGYESFAAGVTVPYKPVDIAMFKAPSGSTKILLLTEKCLYVVDPRSGITLVPWTYSTGTVSVSGGTLTGSGTAWVDNDIQEGDIITIGSESAEITGVGSNTSATIVSGSLSNVSWASYSIQRTFSPGFLGTPTWAKAIDDVAIADGKHALLKYNLDAGTLGYWTTESEKYPPNGQVVPGAVTYWGNRIFIGYITDPVDGLQPGRVMWSAGADETDFSIATNYYDLPYSGGYIQRLLGLNQYLMVYFNDAVYTGYPTNYATLPYRFEKKDTGTIGLVGPYAVAQHLGGHFFVGQDAFYFTNGDEIRPISESLGTKLSGTLEGSGNSYVCVDWVNSTVLFGISDDTGKIVDIWRFDWKGSLWSHDSLTTRFLSNPSLSSSISWDELTGTWDTLSTTSKTWDAFRIDDTQRRVILDSGSRLWRGSLEGSLDFGSTNIVSVLETKDHDFGDPDSTKVFVWISAKIDWNNAPTVPIVFNVEVSKNRGITWKRGGNLIIPVGRDEGYANFRLTGSTFRFRLTSSSPSTSYYFTEYTVRAIRLGDELDTSVQP